jgi:hypothetical protein
MFSFAHSQSAQLVHNATAMLSAAITAQVVAGEDPIPIPLPLPSFAPSSRIAPLLSPNPAKHLSPPLAL